MNRRQKKKLKKRGNFRHYKQYKLIKKFIHDLETNENIQKLFVNAVAHDVVCNKSDFEDNDILDYLREESINAVAPLVPREMLTCNTSSDFECCFKRFADDKRQKEELLVEFGTLFEQLTESFVRKIIKEEKTGGK